MKRIEAYQPDYEKIAEQSSNPAPVIIQLEEYDDFLREHNLHRGELSDVGILQAMELGLIKIWADDGEFDIAKQIQSNNFDVRLAQEFWHFRPHRYSRVTLGDHDEEARELLAYNYRNIGDQFIFHPQGLVHALTLERISLSNVVSCLFDGRSSGGRWGVSIHQTAGTIHSGFVGQILLEVSNANGIDIAVPVGGGIGSLAKFNLLAQPSSRPRNQDATHQWSQMQTSPFGFRLPEWDEEAKRVIAKSNEQLLQGRMF